MKKWILSISSILAIVLFGYFYLNYLIWPGNIDFYLRWDTYQKVADLLLTNYKNDISWLDSGTISTSDGVCSFAKNNDSPPCWEKYIPLFNYSKMVKSSFIKADYEKQIVNFTQEWDLMDDPWTIYHYIYSKKWFSQEEKQSREVVKVMNDHWIITLGNISTPAEIK